MTGKSFLPLHLTKAKGQTQQGLAFFMVQRRAKPARLRDGEGGPQGQTEQKCAAFFAKGRASSEPGTARPGQRPGQPQNLKYCLQFITSPYLIWHKCLETPDKTVASAVVCLDEKEEKFAFLNKKTLVA